MNLLLRSRRGCFSHLAGGNFILLLRGSAITDCAVHWRPAAAYLYILHLDGAALAWEYLRRNPEYRLDWRHHQCGRRQLPAEPTLHWGLRSLEDPEYDARDAQPDWILNPKTLVRIRPDDDPPNQPLPFRLWHFPGRKSLMHDGNRLVLTCQLVGRVLRMAISSTLEDGMAYVYAVRAGYRLCECWHAMVAELVKLDTTKAHRNAIATERPNRTSVLHMRTLQALDGTLAGASHRDIAESLFGPSVVAERWHGDSELRAQVRRLIRRGRVLMAGGYHRLLHIDGAEQGR